jgi:hypothetical protein
MTRAFLSYAEEDQIVGRGLAEALVARGFIVYWWRDPAQQGRRFASAIEKALYEADLFVAVLSPDYLRSPWCTRERNMAVQLEVKRGNEFIAVIQAAEVGSEWSGWLEEYVRIPLQGTDWNGAVDALLRITGPAQPSPASGTPEPRIPEPSSPEPKFRNRDDELDQIVGELTTEGGTDLWLISSPPQLGKSWFLYELADRVTQRISGCKVRLLDVKDDPAALGSDPVLLLKTMFDLSTPLPNHASELTDAVLSRVATEISRRRVQQMYLLDTADLLERGSVEQLHGYLSEIFRKLHESGSNTRVRVVLGGRRIDRWKLVSAVRSSKLRLTEFTEVIVRSALAELAEPNHQLSTEQLNALARRLHRLCAGLPALLVPVLERIGRDDFVGLDDAWWRSAFDEVVRPYVRENLLSADSLCPAGSRDAGKNQELIELGLKMLTPYRMVTMSHLKYQINNDADLRTTLDGAARGPVDLLRALYDTALVTPVTGEPWVEIHPPIRRLLYEYYFTRDEDRLATHRAAQSYYQTWREQHAGKEQPVMLLEYLWHEVMQRSTGLASDGLDSLPAFAAAATREFLQNSIYDALELDLFITDRMEDDLELKLALSGHPGLFDTLLASIKSAIGDDSDE